jgi:hypothetical protein
MKSLCTHIKHRLLSLRLANLLGELVKRYAGHLLVLLANLFSALQRM